MITNLNDILSTSINIEYDKNVIHIITALKNIIHQKNEIILPANDSSAIKHPAMFSLVGPLAAFPLFSSVCFPEK